MSYEAHNLASRDLIARCGVLTLSDTRDQATDSSGAYIKSTLQKAGHFVGEYAVIKDDSDAIYRTLFDWLGRTDIDCVITTGGTGITRRDTTAQVVERMIDTPLPGFGELFRMLSFQEIGAGAMLSRATAGVRRGKLIFALPGSTRAVELAMSRLIVPELRHLLREVRR